MRLSPSGGEWGIVAEGHYPDPPEGFVMSEEQPEKSFATLIERVRRGDQQAADEIFKRYEAPVLRTVRVRMFDARLRRVLESGDILQMVMLSFFAGAAGGKFKLDTPQDLVKLLAQMARNKLDDQIRWEMAAKRGGGGVVDAPEDGIEIPTPGPTPSEVLATREDLERVHSAMAGEEKVIQAYRDDGLSWDEIAAKVGGTGEGVRKRMDRAYERIREQLRSGGAQ